MCSAEVKHHFGRVLDVVLHEVGEPGDGGAVEDPVVGGPADVDHLGFDDLPGGVEAGQRLDFAQSSDGNLRNIRSHVFSRIIF